MYVVLTDSGELFKTDWLYDAAQHSPCWVKRIKPPSVIPNVDYWRATKNEQFMEDIHWTEHPPKDVLTKFLLLE